MDNEGIIAVFDNHFYVASSTCLGRRMRMEDARTIFLESPDDKSCAYFGIFDGHHGCNVAMYASKHLHEKIMHQIDYRKGDIKRGIELGFLSLDDALKKDLKSSADRTGSTALVVLIKGSTLYCGNAGDSRAVAFVNDEVVALSTDHKPTLPEEKARILNAGYNVQRDRINGILAVSRSLGDFMFKMNESKGPEEQALTSFPEVMQLNINDNLKFILLASDGVWDVITNEEIGDFVNTCIENSKRPEDIVEELLNICSTPVDHLGGYDNMTVILIVQLDNMLISYKEQLMNEPIKINRQRSLTHLLPHEISDNE